ncbi:MAG: lipoprotein-releasing system permease protein [Verrucomicrobiales bacterium]|jgi:lipoprotein-releasing system permease protein
MVKNFSLFLALRYLQPKRSFVSVITAISITGVMLGVGVLLVVIAVMSGFENEFKKQLVEFEPHIIFKPTAPFADEDEGWGEPVDDPEDLFGDSEEEIAPVLPPEQAIAQGAVAADPVVINSQPVASHWEVVKKDIMQAFPDIALQVSPFIDARVVLGSTSPYSGDLKEACALVGVDKYDVDQIKKLEELVTYGSFDLSESNIIISRGLANLLEVRLGDPVNVYAPKMFDRILEIMREVQDENAGQTKQELPGLEEFRQQLEELDPHHPTRDSREAILLAYEKTQQALKERDVKSVRDKIDEVDVDTALMVVGIFESPQHDGFAFMPLDIAQRMMFDDFSDNVHGLQITTPDAFKVDEFRDTMRDSLHKHNWEAYTWIEKWQKWFDIFASERSMMFFVLMFIMIVAAFSIMNTTITVAVQKRREIGMMRALGSKASQVIAIFLYKGIIVGFIGTLLGLVAGLSVLHFRNDIRDIAASQLGLEIFPASTFGVTEIPMQLDVTTVCLICFTAFLLSAVAAIIPAWFVTLVDPAKALRNA